MSIACLLWAAVPLAPQLTLSYESPVSARTCILQSSCLGRTQWGHLGSMVRLKSNEPLWVSLSGRGRMAQGWGLIRCVYGSGETQAKKPHLRRWTMAGDLVLAVMAPCWWQSYVWPLLLLLVISKQGWGPSYAYSPWLKTHTDIYTHTDRWYSYIYQGTEHCEFHWT